MVQIEQGSLGHHTEGQWHLVVVKTDSRLRAETGRVEPHATQRVDWRSIRRGGNRQSRHDLRQIIGVGDAEVPQRVAIDGRDGHADVNESLLATFGGHHDFGESIFRANISCQRRVRTVCGADAEWHCDPWDACE